MDVGGIATAVVLLVKFGWDGFRRWRHRRRLRRLERRRWDAYVLQLDEEARGLVFGFLQPGNERRVLNPTDSTVIMLIRDGIIEDVGSAGGYDAVARLFRLRPAVFRRLTGME
ncbi:MAG: hypothetical protein NVV68_06910 [Dokdonella sp.]|nr:hypothetical protein [Dokdonella sp.]